MWSGVSSSDLAPVLRVRARARDDLGAVCLHEDPAVGLLVVAGADHEHLDLEPEYRSGERERAPPLASTRLGREAGHALGLVVVGLGERRIRLVAARRAPALVLVVDVGRRAERPLETMRSIQRAGSVQRVGVADRVRDLDLPFRRDDLLDQLHREQRRQVAWSDRLAGPRVERRAGAARAGRPRCCTRTRGIRLSSRTNLVWRGSAATVDIRDPPERPPRGSCGREREPIARDAEGATAQAGRPMPCPMPAAAGPGRCRCSTPCEVSFGLSLPLPHDLCGSLVLL